MKVTVWSVAVMAAVAATILNVAVCFVVASASVDVTKFLFFDVSVTVPAPSPTFLFSPYTTLYSSVETVFSLNVTVTAGVI